MGITQIIGHAEDPKGSRVWTNERLEIVISVVLIQKFDIHKLDKISREFFFMPLFDSFCYSLREISHKFSRYRSFLGVKIIANLTDTLQKMTNSLLVNVDIPM